MTQKYYRSKDLSELFNIHENTVRSYANKVSDFLSKDALANKRRYTEQDALIILTVSKMRDIGTPFEVITEAIKAGQIETELPELPTPEETEARENVDIVYIPKQERALEQQAFQHRIDMLIQERETLLEKLEQIESERDTAITEREGLKTQIIQLERDISAANAKLEIISTERKSTSYWLIVVVIIAISAILVTAGVLFTVLR